MTAAPEAFGRTIQLFLVDGNPSGLIVASIHGWTGSVLVASQSTFGKLLARPEVDRTGVYILYGPDPQDPLGMRAYIGEAESVRERIDRSAADREFWETAIVVTTSDEALTKGHVRYLEARLIEIAKRAGRVALDNGQEPAADRRRLPEADKAKMEAFLANLKVILPVIGLDLLKPRPKITAGVSTESEPVPETETRFEIRHKSGVKATAIPLPQSLGSRVGCSRPQHQWPYPLVCRRLEANLPRMAGAKGPQRRKYGMSELPEEWPVVATTICWRSGTTGQRCRLRSRPSSPIPRAKGSPVAKPSTQSRPDRSPPAHAQP